MKSMIKIVTWTFWNKINSDCSTINAEINTKNEILNILFIKAI